MAALPLILRDGEITPNDGRFKSEFGQANVSYGRHLCGVSLLDFNSESEERIEEHDGKYNLVRPMPPQVLIKIHRHALDERLLLLPAQLTAGTDHRLAVLPDDIRKMRMYVPAIEAIYLSPLPTSAFVGYVLVGIDDAGQTQWRNFPKQAPEELYECAAEWTREADRHKAARHARGDFTFAEIVQRAEEIPTPPRTLKQIEEIRAELGRAFGWGSKEG